MRRIVSALVVAGSLVLAVATPASAGPVVQVSGEDPFADCSTQGQLGTNYPDTKVEPYVAVNPASLAQDTARRPVARARTHRSSVAGSAVNLIGVWQQDRWSNGGARGLVAAYSFDGGASWAQTPLPFSRCAPNGLDFDRASDPWISIGPDGIAYAVGLSLSAGDTAITAATSTDGGVHWGNVTVVHSDPRAQAFNDKEAVTADPTRPGTAYVVWDRLEPSQAGGVLPDADPQAALAAALGPRVTQSTSGSTWLSRTVDGGRSWSAAEIIVNTGELGIRQTIGNEIVVDPNSGTLYNFFALISGPEIPISEAVVKSIDGGDTWTRPTVIAPIAPGGVPGVRSGGILPEAAIDATTGQLYVVWQDGRFSGGSHSEVALSSSADGGISWSAPVRVNAPSGGPAFTPAVQVNDDGVVAVTYYDFRNNDPENPEVLVTDHWIVFSNDQAGAFGDEQHVAGPFNMRAAPRVPGFFLGDYMGFATVGATFIPFFVQTNCLDDSCSAEHPGTIPTDVFAGPF
jgi:hypothetical protein